MGVYINKYSYILHDYLKKGGSRKRPVRNMTNEDWLVEDQLRQLKKEANLCITEMLLVARIIRKLKEPDLYWVDNNFQRMIHSLHKQRDLVSAACAHFLGLKPNDEELTAITKLVPSIEKRIAFIHAIPIPENIELTPLKEYIEIIGSDNFTDELKKEFPTGVDMYQSKDNGKLDEYIERIFRTLEKNGKQNDYKVRLEKYVKMAKEKKEKHEAEKKAEKLAIATNESMNGIELMKELFFKGIRTLNGCSKIGLGAQSVHNMVNRGHRGEFVVLCCGFGNNKLTYRYLRKNGTLGQWFGGAGTYKTKEEADEMMKAAVAEYPGKSFAVVAI